MKNDFLEKILSTPTVSGFESKGREAFVNYLKPYVDKIEIDSLGNAMAYRIVSSEAPMIMIEAHIDEIGFQVIYIDDNGSIFLRRNGGIDLQCVVGSKVVITTDTGYINGVIGKTPIHLLTTAEREKLPELSSLWVDTGLSADEIKERVKVGAPVSYATNYQWLTEDRITSKALDDKIGVFVVAEVMRRLCENNISNVNVCGVATVQEEVGCRGAAISSFRINPNINITVDVDFATDVPNCPKTKFGDIKLGEGVILSRNLDNNPMLVDNMQEIANNHNICIQLSARPHSTGGTNASRIQLSRQGIMTLSLGIPCRYMHTPVEVCDMRDVDACINLIEDFIRCYNKSNAEFLKSSNEG